MKKIYSVLFVLLSFTSVIYAQTSETLEESFLFYDLTPSRMNGAYSDKSGNTLKFRTNEPVATGAGMLYRTIANPLMCIGTNPTVPPSGTDYASLVIKGIKKAKPVNSPYYVVELNQDNTIRQIQMLGFGSGSNPLASGQLLVAFSTSTDNDTQYYIPDSDEPLTFKNSNCNAGNMLVNVPEGTKFIKFIVTDEYLFWDISLSYDSPPAIHAMRFFAKSTSTGIDDENQANQLTINRQGDVYTLSQLADIVVYNMSGKKVIDVKNSDSFSLEAQNKGIYIVRAKTEDGIITRKLVY